MKITKQTLVSFIASCLFAISFLLNFFPMFKNIKYVFTGGFTSILYFLVSLASVLSIGALAAAVFFRKRSWEIPTLLLVPLVPTVISRLYYLVIGAGVRGWGAFILLDLSITAALFALAYLLIFKPNKVVRKLWFVPIVLLSISLLFMIGGYYSAIAVISNLFYSAAVCLMFYWLAYPKGKAKKVAFDKAPNAASGEGDLFVPFVGHILLILFTCGVYAYIWYFKTTKKLNVYSDDKRSPVGELMLCLFVPLYTIFWTYRTARIVTEISKDKVDFDDFSTACLLLSIFSFGTAPILIQDKLNTLAKIFAEEKKASDAEAAVNTNATPESLLERAKILMGEGSFSEADAVLNTCLMIAPQNADAYLYKFLAKYGVCDLSEFYNRNYNIGSDPALANVLNFADDERKQQINDIAAYLVANNEYLNAVALFEVADYTADYRAAKEAFEKIADFKDSKEYAEKCDAAIAEAETANNADGTKMLIKVGIILAAVTVAVAATMSTTYLIKQSNFRKTTYAEATQLMEEGKYEAAKEAFDEISEYKDSADKSAECSRLDTLYDDFMSALKYNVLNIDFDEYKDLDQDVDYVKTAKKINEQYAKFASLEYDDGTKTAQLIIAYDIENDKVRVQLKPKSSSRYVEGSYTYVTAFDEVLSAKEILGKLPVTIESTERSSKYGYSGDLTINKDGVNYTYNYKNVAYELEMSVK